MYPATLQDRFDTTGLCLIETDLAPLAEHVAEVDRIVAWLRAADLSYADEPVVCFAAPKP
jgi:hypothetical protein